MKWLELKIDAAPAGLEPVSALLEDLGITGLVIDDEGDFQDFLEHNHAYWDYVDDQLMQEKKGLCRITFYLEDSPDGYNTLARVRMALSRVKQEHPEYGRLLLTMESQGCDFLEPNHCDLYIATMDPEGVSRAMQYANLLRQEGFWVEYDLLGRSFKSQMKYADKIGTSYLLVLGENELTTGNANLKNMKTGEQTPLLLDDSFVDSFTNVAMYGMFDGVMDEISF